MTSRSGGSCHAAALKAVLVLVLAAGCGETRSWEEQRADGRAALRAGDLARAEALLTSALAKAEAGDSPASAVPASLDDLTQLYIAKRQLDRAEAHSRAALAKREAMLEPRHRAIVANVARLAWLALRQHRYDEAIALYGRVLAAREAVHGPDHEEVADALDELANAYVRQERHDDALSAYLRALAIRERTLGAGAEAVASALERVAGVHLAAGRPAEAVLVLLRAVAIREDAPSPSPELAESLRQLAVAHAADREYSAADATFRRAIAMLDLPAGQGADPGALRMTLESYAALLLDVGRQEEADRLRARAKQLRARSRTSDEG